MSNINGGFAFPQHGWTSNKEVAESMRQNGGMSLRAYIATSVYADVLRSYCDFDPTHALNSARVAVEFADALIEALGDES